ncbi:30S ribosomal protein S19 [Candidatus Woesearchaeota archaeon]|nr:30S ribosomal protein S19 [Candidatus Woesearchaeota archaeon]
MAKKEFTYRGKTTDELKKLSIQEFMNLIPSRERRKIKRGFTDQEKILLKDIRTGKNDVETHCRDMIILPEMIGLTIKVHTGKEFFPVLIAEDMIGHKLGEFAMTRKNVHHGAAGIGATKSSAHASVH